MRFDVTCSNDVNQDITRHIDLDPTMLPNTFLPQTTLAVSILLTSTLVPEQPIPILDVIKVYGTLAGPHCYGGTSAPSGSSCQLRNDELVDALGFTKLTTRSSSFVTKEDLRTKLEQLEFQWPLKPYGVNDQSLEKTSTMNKGAETKVYMDELESRGLYDRRNPTGPLPTSLRPKLNDVLQREGLQQSRATVDRVFQVLGGNDRTNELRLEQLQSKVFPERPYLDFYGFLDLLGKEQVFWP